MDGGGVGGDLLYGWLSAGPLPPAGHLDSDRFSSRVRMVSVSDTWLEFTGPPVTPPHGFSLYKGGMNRTQRRLRE